MRHVFDEVAVQTGRKTNSVRNYYYTAIRRQMAGEDQAEGLLRRAEAHFTPFADQEIDALLQTILSAQARGMSVRACTLQMGGGDRSRMLRYQNKYRSLLRTHRSRVEELILRMESQSVPCYNPYTGRTLSGGEVCVQSSIRRGRRPRGEKQENVVQSLLDSLESLSDSEVTGILRGVAVLARRAAQRDEAEDRAERLDRELARQQRQTEYYRERLLELTDSVETLLKTRGESLSELLRDDIAEEPVSIQ